MQQFSARPCYSKRDLNIKNTLIISSTLMALLIASSAIADDGSRLDYRGDRINHRLDKRADRRK